MVSMFVFPLINILCISLLIVCYIKLGDSTTTEVPEGTSGSRQTEVVCCECVPFYLCDNGIIISDGEGILDVRIGGMQPSTPPPVVNVDRCPDTLEICCQVPNAPPSCSQEHRQTTDEDIFSVFFPDPLSKCECVTHTECSPDLVVSNGLGTTSLVLNNGRMVNHSQCTHSLDVCCLLQEAEGTANDTSPLSPLISESGEGPCECVPPFLCGPDGYIVTDGVGIINVRIGPSKPPAPCLNDPSKVCCLPPKQEPGSVGIIPTTATSVTPPPPPPPCGKRNYHGIGVRILGFQEGQTQFGEFPWVAAILKDDVMLGKTISLFQGGASLIHKRVVLTAAHKVYGIPASSLIVRLGEWDTTSTKEARPHQDVGVENIIIHEGYNSNSLHHDVALLVLKEDASQDYHIAPICPAKSLDDVIPSSCLINGWGVDQFRSENYQVVMKSIGLPLVAKKKCQQLLRRTRLTKHFQLHRSFICAGGEEGVDACKGDGGGPLSCQMRDDPSRYLQVGITAWGIGCGSKDVPGVYVDVAEHYEWIMGHVNFLFQQTLDLRIGGN